MFSLVVVAHSITTLVVLKKSNTIQLLTNWHKVVDFTWTRASLNSSLIANSSRVKTLIGIKSNAGETRGGLAGTRIVLNIFLLIISGESSTRIPEYSGFGSSIKRMSNVHLLLHFWFSHFQEWHFQKCHFQILFSEMSQWSRCFTLTQWKVLALSESAKKQIWLKMLKIA